MLAFPTVAFAFILVGALLWTLVSSSKPKAIELGRLMLVAGLVAFAVLNSHVFLKL